MQRSNALFALAAIMVLPVLPLAAAARDLNPGAPIVAVPSFSVTVPDYATSNGSPVPVTFVGSITAKGAPAGAVKCPVSIEYDVKVSMSPTMIGPNQALASPYSYVWAPSKPLAGAYDVSNAYPGQGLLSAPLVSSMFVTYDKSSPPEGQAVTFSIGFGGTAGKQMLRAVSHVECTSARQPAPLLH